MERIGMRSLTAKAVNTDTRDFDALNYNVIVLLSNPVMNAVRR
jgi:hypothetical protein